MARSRRGPVLVCLLVAGFGAAYYLGLSPRDLSPGEGGLDTAREFFGAAFRPALVSQDPEFGGHSLLPQALEGARVTVVFAAGAIGLALLFGAALGFLGSTAWWSGDVVGGRFLLLRRTVAPSIYGLVRVLIAAMRSVHEILWAVVFNVIWPETNYLAATIALTIPYAGTFAKLFSEIIDETPRDAALAMRNAGASPLHIFTFGLVPRALPDMTAYTLYRFECALRSAAVLGFFGIPTLGYYINTSFENLYYGEVWTYLYTLLALILAVEIWSGGVRRRLVR